MIYIIKWEGLYQINVNSSFVSSCNYKIGYSLIHSPTKFYFFFRRNGETVVIATKTRGSQWFESSVLKNCLFSSVPLWRKVPKFRNDDVDIKWKKPIKVPVASNKQFSVFLTGSENTHVTILITEINERKYEVSIFVQSFQQRTFQRFYLYLFSVPNIQNILVILFHLKSINILCDNSSSCNSASHVRVPHNCVHLRYSSEVVTKTLNHYRNTLC